MSTRPDEIFKYLFTPITVGSIILRNRIVSTPHGTNYSEGGLPSERQVHYYAEKARGGVGLTEIGALAMPDSLPLYQTIRVYDERCIPGLRRIAEAVHEHGAKVFCQIANQGVWGGAGPSAIPDLTSHVTAEELTVEQIEEWISYYARSACNIKEAGIDGVEIHASHGVASHQFLSPLWNRRTDRYGGSLEARLTFLIEVIGHIRAKVGDSIVLGVRFDADEMIPGGHTLEDGKRIAELLEATRQVDYLSVDIGIEPHQGHIVIAPLYAPAGHMLYAAAAIRGAVERIPIIAVGRITDPIYAEKVLADGYADLVGMTRAIIADPELPNKAREGRLEDIRHCLGDNENCAGRLFAGLPIECTVNPTLGKEKEFGMRALKVAKMKKRVLIVGGGVAGMETARVAALREHSVSLYEREETLGGQVNLAAKLPGRLDIEGIARWLRGQMAKLGVDIHLREEMTATRVLDLNPNAVVVATGALYYKDGFNPATYAPILGWDQKHVVTPEEILSGRKVAGNDVVIQDETGFILGPGLAEWLVDQGKKVEILTSGFFVGTDLLVNYQIAWVYARITAKVTLTSNTLIREISQDAVTVVNVHTGQERRIEGVDTVVLITGKERNDGLHKELKGKVAELHLAGDVSLPHASLYGIGDAIKDGHRVGKLL